MEQYLCEYLLVNKCCPLPGIGELQFNAKSATFSQSEQTMIPPVADVALVRRNVDEAPLIEFISIHSNLSPDICRGLLRNWCNNVLNMESGEKHLSGLGSFYVDTAGRLQFRAQPLHSALLPEVSANRVIRREVNHQILVGDRESTSVQMTEYFQETTKIRRQRWWIAAVVMGTAAALAITVYLASQPNPGLFGNGQALPHSEAKETYIQSK